MSDLQQLASHMSEKFSLKNKFIMNSDWRKFSERSWRMLFLTFKHPISLKVVPHVLKRIITAFLVEEAHLNHSQLTASSSTMLL
jgi:hypothetical protein